MKRSFLKDLGLDADIIDQIMDENGKDINKAKADLETLKEQLATTQDTLKERDTQLEELKKVDVNSLQSKINELQEANKNAQKEYEDKLAEVKLSGALKSTITDAQDFDLVCSLLDKTKLKLEEDGKVNGLEEQLKTLRESKGFLFKNDSNPSGFKPIQSNGGTVQKTEAQLLEEQVAKFFN